MDIVSSSEQCCGIFALPSCVLVRLCVWRSYVGACSTFSF